MSTPLRKRLTQAERIAASDKAMYKAAIKLIARDGPSKMTLASLGKEAGISPSMVNHRFGSKDKMLQMTCERVMKTWSKMLESSIQESGSSLELLESMFRRYLNGFVDRNDLILAQGRLITEAYSSYPELQPICREYNRRIRSFIVDVLKSAQESGEINPDVDLEAFTIMLISSMRGLGNQFLLDNEIDIDASYRFIINTCKQVLAKHETK